MLCWACGELRIFEMKPASKQIPDEKNPRQARWKKPPPLPHSIFVARGGWAQRAMRGPAAFLIETEHLIFPRQNARGKLGGGTTAKCVYLERPDGLEPVRG